MKEGMFRKGLVFSVIILFISVSFQPVFAVDIKPSDETLIESESGNDEKIEYVIQIVRTKKVIEHKIYLTQQQADELENLIDDIRFDLNNAESIEETASIYNDAVTSFNNLGLFPKEITIDEIKQLVFGETQNLNLIKFRKETSGGFENRFCLVSGDTSTTFSLGPVLLLTALIGLPAFTLGAILEILENNYNFSNYKSLDLFLHIVVYLLASPFLFIFLPLSVASVFSRFPVSIGSVITLGARLFDPANDLYHDYPSDGWISTLGINGKQSYSGSFYGQILDLGFFVGIVGFTGIHILNEKTSKVFYLGFALHVNIDTDHP